MCVCVCVCVQALDVGLLCRASHMQIWQLLIGHASSLHPLQLQAADLVDLDAASNAPGAGTASQLQRLAAMRTSVQSR